MILTGHRGGRLGTSALGGYAGLTHAQHQDRSQRIVLCRPGLLNAAQTTLGSQRAERSSEGEGFGQPPSRIR